MQGATARSLDTNRAASLYKEYWQSENQAFTQ